MNDGPLQQKSAVILSQQLHQLIKIAAIFEDNWQKQHPFVISRDGAVLLYKTVMKAQLRLPGNSLCRVHLYENNEHAFIYTDKVCV